ncbi:uncharacterized protein C8Q71DRAFT_855667 [Rhodofomes roseus]|uniref:Uncharacterized protein n=1 Tax=Rhodofomes roseus TaxID=34475 RepID=A0ABQ8KMK8_9APHY|nr:uncharacterized protein C8Q71DRAFT_855667 [Rhodofomes roseus]KAH9839016.1 hypothetical protein C8Q71DRAFT_855667 [Rhodofomes roseus]
MAPPTTTTNLPRFRSSLWFPMDYQILPMRPQVRDANWPLYSAHRAVRVMAALEDGSYAVSPNAHYIPSPPPGPRDREDILSDGRRGIFESGFHAQYWSSARGHLPFIYEVPPGVEGVDPAYVLLDCKRGGRKGTFRIFDTQSGKGKADPVFSMALTGLYDAELRRAEEFLSKDRDPPKSLVLRPADVKESRYQFEYIDSNLEKARNHAATIQRHLLELRAYSYRSYLQRAFDEGRLAAPSPSVFGIGCWVRGGDDELIKRLVWFGIPVWYTRREGPSATQLLLRVHSLDKRLSHEPWDDEEHGPPPEKNKKSSRRQKQRDADFLSADEDSDFDWEKSHGLRRPAPVAGPSLPMTLPSAPPPIVQPVAVRPVATKPVVVKPVVVLQSVAEEEGWVNQIIPDPAPPSSPPRISSPQGRSLIITPPPRIDSPMVVGSPPRSWTRTPASSQRVPSLPLRLAERLPLVNSFVLFVLALLLLLVHLLLFLRAGDALPPRSNAPPAGVPAPLLLAATASERTDQRGSDLPQGCASLRRSRSPASSSKPRAPENPAIPTPSSSSLPLGRRIAPPDSERPRRSLLDRLEPTSLLARLNPPSGKDREDGELQEEEGRAGTSLFRRMGVPLEERISGTTHLLPPAPPATTPPEELHTVNLPSGVPLRTRLPLHSAAEVDEYLHHPFERDGNVPVIRLKGEDELGPAPVFPKDAGAPVPSPQLLLAGGDEGYLSTITWLQNRGPCLLRLQRKPEDWVLRNHRQWKSNLRGPPNLVKAARNNPRRPLPDDAIDPLRNPLPNERENEIWSLRTFLFRYNFERLAARRLPSLQAATTDAARGAIWAGVRDRIRRVWGHGTTIYPSVDEPRYFDSDDDVVRMRHWFAIGRLMLEWDLREDIAQDLRLAMGGTVTDAVERIKAAYTNVYRTTFENRDPQAFARARCYLARAQQLDAKLLPVQLHHSPVCDTAPYELGAESLSRVSSSLLDAQCVLLAALKDRLLAYSCPELGSSSSRHLSSSLQARLTLAGYPPANVHEYGRRLLASTQ